MRGNRIEIESMFTFKNLVKPEIRWELIERIQLSSDQTKPGVSAMLKELSTTNKDPPAELVKLETHDFPYFCMRSMEDIK